ncbi:DUF2815 family protein [Corynebacterium lujinxingii]|uniref:DUF2815 family protein n=1 Tax=Corynebacterium lujinxingii TaxID=2763010 RepID=A0A7H0K0R3_9CORY|nr:DUF2815 family protein [Corynebacterium lujinxingii]MBC3179375.1 DUF2815 family protein [Corynebacterium lujinxingii]NNO11485.1 DUF2815 family protein [Corynebacterium lujinxingii]QNP90879.1 DUF2815 family protein [Corynebacterium lujinxingii]
MATISNRAVKAQGRLSYPNLFTARAANETAKPKYGATLLIPKTDTATVERIQAAIDAAVKDGIERRIFKGAVDPSRSKYPPLRDGDTPKDDGSERGEEFAGHWFISAKAPGDKPRPAVVDANVQPVMDESEIYAGCYVNMFVEFYAYENSGNKGIAASLRGTQFVRDGDRLGGETLEAEDMFSAVAGADTASSADDDWL